MEEKERYGNIAFRVKDTRLHEHRLVYDAIIEKHEKMQANQLQGQRKRCSVCGVSDFPVVDKPHGLIKHVPDGSVQVVLWFHIMRMHLNHTG